VYFSHDDALVLALKMRFVGRNPLKEYWWTSSSTNILYKSTFDQMGLSIDNLSLILTSLVIFSGDTLYSLGTVLLEVHFGSASCTISLQLMFLVLDVPSTYNTILGQGALNKLRAVVFMSHLMMKIPYPIRN
jgi:hypothetical protein